MNIVIFSGGTGSIALQNGLKKLVPYCNITNIINAYDDGKSTGICRDILGVLGPSDIRKNHEVQYRNAHIDNINSNYIEFFTNRYDLPVGNEVDFCVNMLNKWEIFTEDELNNRPCSIINSILNFFWIGSDTEHCIKEYRDFNISNIVYSILFSNIGYEKTIELFRKKFGITDNIILNNFNNMILKAKTNTGRILNRESEIVNFGKHINEEYIEDIFFEDVDDSVLPIHQRVSPNLDVIFEADLIIYSAGTQWSSLIPTYATVSSKLFSHLTKAKKIMIMNVDYDNDIIGWTAKDIYNKVNEYVPIDDVIVAKDSIINELSYLDIGIHKNLVSSTNSSVHDPDKLASAILNIYFNIENKNVSNLPDIIYIDFDDTIWPRKDKNVSEIGKQNINKLIELSKYTNIAIVTGNSYKSIYRKLSKIYGSEMNISNNIDIFADGGVIKYLNNRADWYYKTNDIFINALDTTIIKDFIRENIPSLIDKIEYRGTTDIKNNLYYTAIISIKPIFDDNFRQTIVNYLNLYFKICNTSFVARSTGKTTIDITHSSLDKVLALNYYENHSELNSYYIGDECDSGNDANIAAKCSSYFKVNDPEETSVILKLLIDKFERMNEH